MAARGNLGIEALFSRNERMLDGRDRTVKARVLVFARALRCSFTLL